jgi:GNAT superfamily N-acetyltransferase
MPGEDSIEGYPADLVCSAVLTDHRSVFIRPIRPSDAAELRRAIATADPEVLYARFIGAPPHDDASIRRLVEVDYVHRLALAAISDDGAGVGIARYEGQAGSDSAEVAIVIDPQWQRVGLGSLLLQMLCDAARNRGIREFTALTLGDNRAVRSLLSSSGLFFSVEIDSGVAKIVIALDGQVIPDTARRPGP